MRHTSNHRMPVLDLPWKYQHKHQLSEYLKHRDTYAPGLSVKWQSTAIDFAHSVHPINQHYKGSYWKAARRTCLLYDWTGHGHNQLKKSTHGTSPLPLHPHAPCRHCGQHDDQSHILLQCPNPVLSPIRIAARVSQATIAQKLQSEASSNLERHFITQLQLASWLSSSPATARIWTGMWTRAILTSMFPTAHNMSSPLSHSERHKYRRLAQLLTQPLIGAYRQMIGASSMGPRHGRNHRPTIPRTI